MAPQSDDLPHPEAARRLRRALSELRSEGIDAHGQVVHPDPYTAAMEATHDERIDEIIVSTFPSERSGWLRRDLVEPAPRRDGPAGRPRRLRGRPNERPRRAARPRPAHHGNANEHPPPIHYSSRINPLIVGIFLFIGSEIMLFGSFFTVYFFVRVVNGAVASRPWPPYIPGTHIQFDRPWFLALVNTCILVTSSFTMHWATRSVKKGNRAGLCAGMVLTLLLGSTFLLTQVIEYHRIGFNTSDTAFAATFFGLTGLHAFHVFIGLTILLAMTIRSFRGHFSPEHHHGLEVGGIYWHFVDVMWIVVYVTVYIL